MSPTQNLAPTRPPRPRRPPTAVRSPAPGGRRRMEVVVGIGLVAFWALSGFLLELGLLEVVLLGALLLAVFHTLVRRRPLRTLLVRDTASFARHWWGSCWSPPSWSRYRRPWWSRRWAAAGRPVCRRQLEGAAPARRPGRGLPRLASPRHHGAHRCGDRRAGVLGLVPEPGRHPQRRRHGPRRHRPSGRQGMLAGHHDIAVAEVDLDSAQPVRLAGIGADDTTPMEVGSMTKAMTGLVIADAVSRGEIRMDAPVATYLPQLGGLTGRCRDDQRARHAHLRIRRVRRRHPAPRRLGGAAGQKLLDRRHHADDRGGQGPDPGERRAVRLLLPGCGHRRSSRRRGSPPELPGADAHPAVRAARHVPHRHPGRHRTRPRRHIPDRPSGPAVGHGCLRTHRRSRLHHRRPREARHRTPRRNRPRPGRSGAHHRHRPVEHQDRHLLAYLHLADRSDHHPSRRADRRLRLLPRPRPPGPHKAVIVLSDVANDAGDLGSQLLADRQKGTS